MTKPPGVNRMVVGARNYPELGKCVLTLECGHEVVFDHSVTSDVARIAVTACAQCEQGNRPVGN